MDPFTSTLVALTLTASTGAAFVGIHRHQMKQHKRRQVIWRNLATILSGEFRKGSNSWFKADPDVVLVELDHVLVRMDWYLVSVGDSSVPFTRVRAQWIAGEGAAFTLRKKTRLRSIADRVGVMKDVVLDDESFDGSFFLRSPHGAAVLRRTLTASIRSRFRAVPDRQRALVSKEGEVTLSWVLGNDNEETLESAIRLIAELCGTGLQDFVDVTSSCRFVAPTGPWDARTPLRAVRAVSTGEVAYALIVRDGAPFMEASTACDRDYPRFSADLETDPLPQGLLRDQDRSRATQIGRATLSFDGQRFALRWSEFPSAEQSSVASDLLLSLASRSGGFR